MSSDALSEALWRHQPRQTLLRGVERCICGDGTVGEPGWFRRHQRDAVQAAAARLLGDAEARAWPCANYLSPLTCLTAPSSEAGRCDWCRGLLADAEAKAEARGRREAEARHRDLTSRLGFGDNITEPQADNDTIMEYVEARFAEARDWADLQSWQTDCFLAGHPDDDDCWEHNPILRAETRGAERALAMVEDWFSDIDLDDLRAALATGDPA